MNFFVSAIDRFGLLPVNELRNRGESSIQLEGKAEREEEGGEADLNLSLLDNERESKEKEAIVPIGAVVDSVITGESSENSQSNKAIVTKERTKKGKERKSGRKRKVVEREEDAADKPESLKDAERKSPRIKSIRKRKHPLTLGTVAFFPTFENTVALKQRS